MKAIAILNVVASSDSVEVLIYGPIASNKFWDEDVGADEIKKELAAHKGKPLTVRINSPGGDFFGGAAIYTALKDHDAPVTVKIDGIAASAASLVAMAGSKILISPTGTVLIHKASTFAYANSDGLEKSIAMLKKIDGIMAAAYASKTGKTSEDMLALMAEETLMTPDEALTAGFVDAIMDFKPEQQKAVRAVASMAVADAIDGMSAAADRLSERAERQKILSENLKIINLLKGK